LRTFGSTLMLAVLFRVPSACLRQAGVFRGSVCFNQRFAAPFWAKEKRMF
jgi:hypothetical protein